MTPQEFITKWSGSTLKESAAAQEHFIDLCRMLGEKTPAEADPDGDWYAFEKGALKVGGGDGWADVWKRGCFAWEYKGKGKDLGQALKQLKTYAGSLQNPPNLYNERPAWLDHAHRELDAAVAAAYGWTD